MRGAELSGLSRAEAACGRHADAVVPLADPRRELIALRGEVESALARVVDSGRYVLGPEVESFEAEFATYLGVRHAVGVACGTDALELAIRALGCGPGDEVLTVANAGGYATAAALAAGCRPVYIEIDPHSLLADVGDLAARLGPRVGAVVVTHLYGRIHPAIEDVIAACRRTGTPVVEDCAQSSGATAGGRAAGSFGTMAAHSFYPTKNLGAIGDGGAVSTDDAELARRVRSLRQYGWGARREVRLVGGRNSRLDELQAAVLRLKLPLLEDRVARRRSIVERYRAAAPDLRWVGTAGPDDACHLCVARIPDRVGFRARASIAGVQTAVHYPRPDYLRPGLSSDGPRLPMTELACQQVVSLPVHPFLAEREIALVEDLLART